MRAGKKLGCYSLFPVLFTYLLYFHIVIFHLLRFETHSINLQKVIVPSRRSSIAVASSTDKEAQVSPQQTQPSASNTLTKTTIAIHTNNDRPGVCPSPPPPSVYQKRKSDIYAPISFQRRSSSFRYSFSQTNRLLSEACNICLGEYEEGEDICWYVFSFFCDVFLLNSLFGSNADLHRTSCLCCFVYFRRSHNPDCTHAFHKACITEWLTKNDICPCCRQPYIERSD